MRLIMLKLPPPIWALSYVLAAAVICWSFGWPKLFGFLNVPLGIGLIAGALIPMVWGNRRLPP